MTQTVRAHQDVTARSSSTLVGQAPFRAAPPPLLGHLEVEAVVSPFRGEEGGDWYDVLEVHSGGAAITVIDAAGYGPAAATLAAKLRAAYSRERVLRGEPARALATLDPALADYAEHFATGICVVWSPTGPPVRMANAGHIPPVVVEPEGAFFLSDEPDPPLGLSDARSSSEHHISPGAALVLCTDGLVERRGTSLAHGLAVLRSVLSRRPPAETAAVSVFAEMLQMLGPLEDDATVVVVRARA
jgi:serine phosphatase RsbU (regulator of sigma subunit)